MPPLKERGRRDALARDITTGKRPKSPSEKIAMTEQMNRAQLEMSQAEEAIEAEERRLDAIEQVINPEYQKKWQEVLQLAKEALDGNIHDIQHLSTIISHCIVKKDGTFERPSEDSDSTRLFSRLKQWYQANSKFHEYPKQYGIALENIDESIDNMTKTSEEINNVIGALDPEDSGLASEPITKNIKEPSARRKDKSTIAKTRTSGRTKVTSAPVMTKAIPRLIGPKKRGRPPKSTTIMPEEAPPTGPKKRGRPPVTTAKSPTAKSPTGGGRGGARPGAGRPRTPKSTTTVVDKYQAELLARKGLGKNQRKNLNEIEDPGNEITSTTGPKKRGRPPKSTTISEPPTKKKKGWPKGKPRGTTRKEDPPSTEPTKKNKAGRPKGKPSGARETHAPVGDPPTGKRTRSSRIQEKDALTDTNHLQVAIFDNPAEPPKKKTRLARLPMATLKTYPTDLVTLEKGHVTLEKQEQCWKACFTHPFNWFDYKVAGNNFISKVKTGCVYVDKELAHFKDSVSGEIDTFDIQASKSLVFPGHMIQDEHGIPTRIVCKLNSANLLEPSKIFCVTENFPDMVMDIPLGYDNLNSLIKCADDLIVADKNRLPLWIGNKFNMIPNWIDEDEQPWDDVLKEMGALMKWKIIAEDSTRFYFRFQFLQYHRLDHLPTETIIMPHPHIRIVTDYFSINKAASETEVTSCMEEYSFFKELKDEWDHSTIPKFEPRTGLKMHSILGNAKFIREHVHG
jgi:hypothetical protein